MRFGVIQFPGSCDERDTLQAAALAGDARLLWHGERELGDLDAVILPGGFSYGDYLRPGALARFSPVMSAVEQWAREGGLVLGICNGFQVLCEAGLLPGALLPNAGRRFICRDVELEVCGQVGPFTNRVPRAHPLVIPAKHAAGRYHADHGTLEQLQDEGRILLRYSSGSGFNGSLRGIAGVCNERGNVFGMMPHPEHAVDARLGTTDGLGIFMSMRSAIEGGAAGADGVTPAGGSTKPRPGADG